MGKIRIVGTETGILYVEVTCDCGKDQLIGIKPEGVGLTVTSFKRNIPMSTTKGQVEFRPRVVA